MEPRGRSKFTEKITTSNEVDEAQIKKEMDGETYIEKCLKEKEKSV